MSVPRRALSAVPPPERDGNGGEASIPPPAAGGPWRPLGADPHDFAGLYVRHRSSFAAYARRFVHSPSDVEDVLQDAFLRLFLALPELETELQALAYCRRTIRNLCIDRYRSAQSRPNLVDLDTVDADPSEEDDDPVLRAEDAAIVRQALALLSPLHQAALVKREIEEKPLPQIAAELGIADDSVKHLLHRARRSLRRLLAGTTVDPAVDPSNRDLLRAANERLGQGMLRGGAFVLIVLVAAAVVATGVVSNGARRGATGGGVASVQIGPGSDGVGSFVPSHGRVAAPGAVPANRAHRHTPHPGAVRHVSVPLAPTPTHDAGPAAGAVLHSSGGIHGAPAWNRLGGRRGTGSPGAGHSGPTYTVVGALHATGAVTVRTLSRSIDAGQGATGTSLLQAPTKVGTFQLSQTVSTASSGAVAVTVQPLLAAGDAPAATAPVASAAAVTRDPSGLLDITVNEVVTDPGALPYPVGRISVRMQVSGDLATVVHETVSTVAAGVGVASASPVIPAPAPASAPPPVVDAEPANQTSVTPASVVTQDFSNTP